MTTTATNRQRNVRDPLDPGGAPVNDLAVALDGSAHAERAIGVADALAAAAQLSLRLVTVRPSEADVASAESYLARLARRTPSVSSVTVRVARDVGAALAEEVDDALLVLATHAWGALGEILFGSTADRVLGRADRPVLLVGPNAGMPDRAFDTIVVPDDGGVRGRRLRPFVAEWSNHLGAVPWVVQVLASGTPAPNLEVLESAHVSAVARELGPAAEWDVLHGHDPADEIVTFAAERKAALIAMAVPPRHRLGPDLAGGAALQVVRQAACPVLAING